MKTFVTGAAGALAMLALVFSVAWAGDIFRVEKNGTVYLRVTDDGTVGIGTGTPEAAIHAKTSDTTTTPLKVDYFGTLVPGAQYRKPVTITGSTGGSVTDYQVKVTVGFVSGKMNSDFSDIRLKKNVNPLTNALDRMLRLQGVTYVWKDPAKHGNLTGTQMGMIAQEVERVSPEWVGTDGTGYKDLTFRGFEALTVEAMRELKKENDQLRGRIDELEITIKAILNRSGSGDVKTR